MPAKNSKNINSRKPLSLAPLSFDEALGAILQVKPEPKANTKLNSAKATKQAKRKG